MYKDGALELKVVSGLRNHFYHIDLKEIQIERDIHTYGKSDSRKEGKNRYDRTHPLVVLVPKDGTKITLKWDKIFLKNSRLLAG